MAGPVVPEVARKQSSMTERVQQSEDEWREKLTEPAFEVCRRKGTEPPFTGEYYHCNTPGTYLCVCCGNELFSSDAKYDSHSGWPSFTQAAGADSVSTAVDRSHGMVRTEISCLRCGSHLGHVFEDGPAPGGQRYCVNSVALRLRTQSS